MTLGLAGFIGLGLFGAAATERRDALWGVVELCVANEKTTGFAFPCLTVDISQGAERGFAVLRPPVGPPDTILSPTRESAGIEDPDLQSAEAPNYFAEAWNARRLVPNAERRLPEPDAFALGVNSRFARTQDQLHIHIGCVQTKVRYRLRLLAANLPVGVWSRVTMLLLGHEAWILRTGQTDIERLRPFELMAQRIAKQPWGDMSEVTFGIAPVKIGEGMEYVLMAFPSVGRGVHPELDINSEDFIDARCDAAGK